MSSLSQQYRDMIAAKAPLRDFRVMLIGELDKAEQGVPLDPVAIANEVSRSLGTVGIQLFEVDDGAIDLVREKDIDMVKASLCTNFSKAKFECAAKLIGGARMGMNSDGHKRERTDSGWLADLRNKAESGEIPLQELKRNLKIAILRELDADCHREEEIAEKVAEDAERRLKEAGESLFDEDDDAISFRRVGRPDVGEETLHEVKAAMQLNFSREKLKYASQLQFELRRRGVEGFQVKMKSENVGSSGRAESNGRRNRNEVRRTSVGHNGVGRRRSSSGNSACRTSKWIFAVASAAILVVVALIIKAKFLRVN